MRWLTGVGMDGLELRDQLDRHAARPARLRARSCARSSTRTRASCRPTCCGCATSTRCAPSTRRTRARARCLATARRRSPTGCRPRRREHFAAVRAFLDARGVAYRVEPTLVRGLDYYTHTAWEIKWPPLGAQSTVSGGGRYDGFAEIDRRPADAGHRLRPRHRAASCWRCEDQGAPRRWWPRRGADAVRPGDGATRPGRALHALLDELRLARRACRGRPGGPQRQGPAEARRAGWRRAAGRRQCGPDEWAAGTVLLRDRTRGGTETVALRRPRARRHRKDRNVSWYRTHGCGELARRTRRRARSSCPAGRRAGTATTAA